MFYGIVASTAEGCCEQCWLSAALLCWITVCKGAMTALVSCCQTRLRDVLRFVKKCDNCDGVPLRAFTLLSLLLCLLQAGMGVAPFPAS
jgi:hypothetical protein